jgi:hypothetical protein
LNIIGVGGFTIRNSAPCISQLIMLAGAPIAFQYPMFFRSESLGLSDCIHGLFSLNNAPSLSTIDIASLSDLCSNIFAQSRCGAVMILSANALCSYTVVRFDGQKATSWPCFWQKTQCSSLPWNAFFFSTKNVETCRLVLLGLFIPCNLASVQCFCISPSLWLRGSMPLSRVGAPLIMTRSYRSFAAVCRSLFAIGCCCVRLICLLCDVINIGDAASSPSRQDRVLLGTLCGAEELELEEDTNQQLWR